MNSDKIPDTTGATPTDTVCYFHLRQAMQRMFPPAAQAPVCLPPACATDPSANEEDDLVVPPSQLTNSSLDPKL